MNKKLSDAFHLAVLVCLTFFFNIPTAGQNLRFERLNINNGLSQNDVMEIMQDSKGYIWFGSLDGLNKYDGYQFTTFQREPYSDGTLTMNAVTGIWQSADGKIWMHPVNSDLNLYDPITNTFSVVKPESETKFHFDTRLISDLEEDKDGGIWTFNQAGQLCRFNKTDRRIIGDDLSTMFLNNPYNKENANKSIIDLFRDKKGDLWVGSTEGLHKVNLVPGKNGKHSEINIVHYWRNPKDSNSIIAAGRIFEDHSSKFWMRGSGTLACFDAQNGQIIKFRHQPDNINSLSDNRISKITEDAQGNLWIATHNGLNRLDKERKNFTRYYHDPTDPNSLGGNLILSLIIDRSNIMWIGTLQGGISKANLNYYSFPLYQHNPFNKNSLSNNKVTAICEDKEGIVWIGTLEGGLNAWNKATGEFKHYRSNPADSSGLYTDAIGAVLEDRAGNLWIGSGKSGMIVLSKLNRKSNRFEHHYLEYPIANPYAVLFTLYEDRDGLFWIGTVNGIVTFDRLTNQSVHYPYDKDKPEGLSDPWIFSFCEDKDGNMWIGTSTERLNKLDKKTGKYTHYTYNAKDTGSISSSTARCIYKDSKGILWFGTFGGGLCRMNPSNESFTAYTTKDGLPSNTIHSIQEDDEGNLWLGTGRGLSRFSLKDFSFLNYDDKDGLQSNQFTIGQISPGPSFKGKDGTLYFGGINGFNAFHPKNLKRNQYIPPVVISQFALFDKPVAGLNVENEIRLKYNQNFFSFEFTALDYTNSKKNRYAYKLEGVDKDWIYCGTNRIARYTDVPYGQYVFRVKATNSDGIWNENGVNISVVISPPWWRTAVAYIFYSLCFLIGIYFIHRLQKQRVIRKERERIKERELKQAKEIEKAYHELKTTQQQLIHSEKMASLGELTAGIAHEIQNPLNFVNNFSEVSKELLDEMKEAIEKGDTEDAKEIMNDVIQNLEKINHHGKRADGIVKGMLQHSRTSSGQKEPTDINALCDEYLRLAYHGLRAKDKSFNAKFETNFDTSIDKVNVVPQEIGRVILNLINNAFYAVSERKKLNEPGYEPTVSVSTIKDGDSIKIKVSDNGTGIPQKVLDKIFQPFFTTKPTGQGTGLGLSLSYDIVKAHGGELKVETKEGEGTEFIILLPV